MNDLHPSVQEKLNWFEDTDHIPYMHRWVAGYCRDLANIVSSVPSHPQLTIGLQHLIEAQDCFVRAIIAGAKVDTEIKLADTEFKVE